MAKKIEIKKEKRTLQNMYEFRNFLKNCKNSPMIALAVCILLMLAILFANASFRNDDLQSSKPLILSQKVTSEKKPAEESHFSVAEPLPVEKSTDKPQNETKDVPQGSQEIRLNEILSLMGTVIQGVHDSYAVIKENATGDEKLVKKGETIQNALLAEIMQNSVLLRMGNSEQFLYLKKGEGDFDEEGLDDIDDDIEETEPVVAVKAHLSPREINEICRYDEDIKQVMRLMNQIEFLEDKENEEEFMADEEENEQTDSAKGVTISHIEPDSVFQRIGLEVNDVIVAIDDKTIETVDDSFEIYETLRTSLGGSIHIKRNGKSESLVYRREML